jgi:hypothetical protein
MKRITIKITVKDPETGVQIFTTENSQDTLIASGPATFKAAVGATEVALSNLHRHCCPTDEEAIATADDAAPTEDVSND